MHTVVDRKTFKLISLEIASEFVFEQILEKMLKDINNKHKKDVLDIERSKNPDQILDKTFEETAIKRIFISIGTNLEYPIKRLEKKMEKLIQKESQDVLDKESQDVLNKIKVIELVERTDQDLTKIIFGQSKCTLDTYKYESISDFRKLIEPIIEAKEKKNVFLEQGEKKDIITIDCAFLEYNLEFENFTIHFFNQTTSATHDFKLSPDLNNLLEFLVSQNVLINFFYVVPAHKFDKFSIKTLTYSFQGVEEYVKNERYKILITNRLLNNLKKLSTTVKFFALSLKSTDLLKACFMKAEKMAYKISTD